MLQVIQTSPVETEFTCILNDKFHTHAAIIVYDDDDDDANTTSSVANLSYERRETVP